MDKSYTQAAQDVIALAQRQKGLIDLGAYLEQLGALEGHEGEIRKRIDRAVADEQAAIQARGVAEGALSFVEEAVKAAKAHAEEIEVEARAEGNRIISSAVAQAGGILESAQGKVVALELRVASQKDALEKLDMEIAGREKALVDINARIDNLRKQMAAFVSGGEQ